jgi:hypothetical protein
MPNYNPKKTSYLDKTVSPGTTYLYEITAYDTDFNFGSKQSSGAMTDPAPRNLPEKAALATKEILP